MNAGQDAENGESLPDEATLLEAPGPAAPIRAAPVERLQYIADMVHELKIMSAQASCQTLASLLELAYLEAVRQHCSRSQRAST